MNEEIIIAGFGGQGVLSMGMVLCYAGMIENKEVSWMPSYGPEMRGGTANCITIISDSKISSPIISKFDTVLALNQPSVDKFVDSVKPGGTLIYDSTNVIHPPSREEIEIFAIEATREAAAMKNTKVLNMIMLGAFLKLKPIIELENIIEGLKKVLPERYHHMLKINEDAIRKGMELIESSVASA